MSDSAPVRVRQIVLLSLLGAMVVASGVLASVAFAGLLPGAGLEAAAGAGDPVGSIALVGALLASLLGIGTVCALASVLGGDRTDDVRVPDEHDATPTPVA